MLAQEVTVHFVDGTSRETTLTQWSIGQFAQYAAKQGWKVDARDPGLMAVTMLRFQAYAEMHRDPQATRAPFETWDRTVDSVEASEAEEVDPTQTAT